MQPQLIIIVLPAQALYTHLAQAGEEVFVEKLPTKRVSKVFIVDVLRQTRKQNSVKVNFLALTPSL